MQKRGKTAAGTQRWQCALCRVSGIRRRRDVVMRHTQAHFMRWIRGTASLTEVGCALGLSRKQLTARFQACWNAPPPEPLNHGKADSILIVDGVYLSGRVNAVLIARTIQTVRSWHFSERENYAAWDAFFSSLPAPSVIVMDGQKGLQEAVSRRFPRARIQRCLAHVERFVRMCLSRRPKTDAGQELWHLVRSTWEVKTIESAERWIRLFAQWEDQYAGFLKERSRSSETGRWWYTHRSSVRLVLTLKTLCRTSSSSLK
jgi:hypothetical protein